MSTSAIARRGVRDTERALAPDLARGLAILLIALSNTVFHLWAARYGPSGWHPVDGAVLDRVVQFAMVVGLDLRVYPLFAFLFGYGMTQLYRRQLTAGTTPGDARGLLRRRSLWLVLFGAVHAALLMAGDILGAWGLLSLVLGTLFVSRRPRTQLIAAGVAAVLVLLATVAAAATVATSARSEWAPGAVTQPTVELYASDEASWLAAAATRLTTWVFVTASVPLALPAIVAMLLGMWAAGRRVLDDPAVHRRLLGWTAAVGIPVGWLGGLPAALVHTDLLALDPAMTSGSGELFVLASMTGTFGGLGYVALIGLAATVLRRDGAVVGAVAAVGKRSLSAYLTHSLLFAPLLAAWGLGLGAHLTSASMALVAVGVWLVTVVGAVVLERRGAPGPAEALLRRLVYRG